MMRPIDGGISAVMMAAARGDHGGEGGAVAALSSSPGPSVFASMAASALDDAVRPPSRVASTVHICASAPVRWPASASASASRLPRDAGRVHDGAGQHEERHGQQRVRVGRRDHLLHEDVERDLAVDEEEGQRADRDREGDRHVEREQHAHQDRREPSSSTSAPAPRVAAEQHVLDVAHDHQREADRDRPVEHGQRRAQHRRSGCPRRRSRSARRTTP